MGKLKIGTRVIHPTFGKGTIKCDDNSLFCNYLVEFDNTNKILHDGGISGYKGRKKSCWFCDVSTFKIIEEDNNVPELKERYIVTYRNGEEAMYLGDKFVRPLRTIRHGEFTSTNKSANMIGRIDTSTLKHEDDRRYDIVAVHRPEYKTIWTRKDNNIKLTKEDIEEILGYKIEIVEGEK